MKKKHDRIKLILFAIVSSIFLLLSTSAKSEIPPDIKKIINRGKIIVAMSSIDYPPFFYHENDSLIGYDIEVAKDIAKSLGVNIEFNRSARSFSDVVKLVENESADLAISAISSTLKRGLSVNFSEPYLSPSQCIILNRILEVKLKNKDGFDKNINKVAILKNSSYEDFSKQNKEFFEDSLNESQIVAYENLDQALNDVMSGKILGLYVDEIYANYVIKNKKLANLYVRKKTLEGTIDPITIAVNWKNNNLLSWINLYIKRMKYDGKERYLTRKYLRDQK